MPWDDLLKEVFATKARGKKYSITEDLEVKKEYEKSEFKKYLKPRMYKAYSLGKEYRDKYFTKREAECMVWLLKGKTVNSVAELLNLSPRTVEYYLRNMKSKLGCRTKFELIDLVHTSDFLKNVDF